MKKPLLSNFRKIVFAFAAITITVSACKKEEEEVDDEIPESTTTPYNLVIPAGFPAMNIPIDNALTVEGVALGRRLFYDPILSSNNLVSCSSCHNQQMAFTDNGSQYSFGVDSIAGTRNSMPIMNLGWAPNFFWDGGATNLESQAIAPITDPIEMHQTLDETVSKLNIHPEYPALFNKAFGSSVITSAALIRAIAQFERTIISANSKYDKFLKGEVTLTTQEQSGLAIYTDAAKGNCNSCHTLGGTFTNYDFKNNGLDVVSTDEGRGRITTLESDKGKFKTPSLRNIAVSGPYMHDGRFSTLEQCVNHYNTGIQNHPNLATEFTGAISGRMSAQEMQDLVAFLNTLTDESYLTNSAYGKP
jgi:cytochrome c peroxidase